MAYRIKRTNGVAKLVRKPSRRYVPKPRPKLSPHRGGLQWLWQAIWNDTKVRAPLARVWWRQGHAMDVNGWGIREYEDGANSVWRSPGERVRIHATANNVQARRIRKQQLIS